jgi:hypothetical protein
LLIRFHGLRFDIQRDVGVSYVGWHALC